MNTRALATVRPTTVGSAVQAVVATVATALICMGLSIAALAPAHSAPVGSVLVTSTDAEADIYEARVQRLVNMRRAAHGLPRLRLAACADNSAESWARHLAVVTDTLYHQSMTSLLVQCDAQYAGETLGRGTMTPRKLVRMWMQSPAHRAVLISSKSRRIGVGVAPDADGRWVIAANFIRF